MTVETASISPALVPPKKRDFSADYPALTSSPDMEDDRSRLLAHHNSHHSAPSSPPPTPDQSSSPPSHHSHHQQPTNSYKSEPMLKSSGFSIADILSPPSVSIPPGLRIEQFAAAHHLAAAAAARVPSPHGDRDSSDDAGSYKDNDLSDDGEGNINFYLLYCIKFIFQRLLISF